MPVVKYYKLQIGIGEVFRTEEAFVDEDGRIQGDFVRLPIGKDVLISEQMWNKIKVDYGPGSGSDCIKVVK